MVLLRYVYPRRRLRDDHSRRTVPAGHATGRAGLLQSDDHAARPGYGLRRDHAVLCRPGELAAAHDDRGAGYGPAAHEQLEFLDSAAGLLAAGLDPVYGRGRPGLRLDLLRAAVHHLCAAVRHLLYFRHSYSGDVVHHGLDQHYRHGDEHARPGHDLHENAPVRLDLADHGLPARGRYAGAGRRGNHDADGHSLRHQLLLGGRWRRSGAVPAHLLVLRPPRGVHHHSAGLRCRVADHPRFQPQAAVRLRLHGLCHGGHRLLVIYRLGAPYVHGGHAHSG